MVKEISVKTAQPALYGLLKADLPEGVEITSPPPDEKLLNEEWLALLEPTTIDLMIDPVTIEGMAACNWIASAHPETIFGH